MATTEHTINDSLAAVLRATRRAWRLSSVVSSENTGMLKNSNERPDILVIEANVSPVTIETEVLPATTVESDAIARLGKQLRVTGRSILSAVAVRLPVRLRSKQAEALQSELTMATDLEMALYTGVDPTNYDRWPHTGWILGSVYDLSLLVQSASIPPKIIDEAADHLVSGVSEAAGLLAEMSKSNPGAIHKISEELLQEDGEQTRRMATTILANAIMFHESLAGGPGELAGVKSLEQLRGSGAGLRTPNKTVLEDNWCK